MAWREHKSPGTGHVSYYVATYFQKKQYWEHAGTNKREAIRLDAQRKREVEQGIYVPPKLREQVAAVPTFEEFSKQWGNARTNDTADDDRRNLARFLDVPTFGGTRMDELRPRHTRMALDWLKANGNVKLKTLQNAYGTFRTMCRDAQIAEIVTVDPCVLPRGYFEGDDTTERKPYDRTESALLIAHHLIPEPVQVLNAMCLLAGFREGEACGRRWGDLDLDARPLAAFEVRTQYGGRKLKTRRPRAVPVHPELRLLLERWAGDGFVKLMGRRPTPEDYIVPHRSNRSKVGHWTKSTYYKAFVRYAVAAGVQPRTLHSMRHTMITLARRGGARKDVLEKVTHNAKGDIVDRYTHLDWAPLCEAVAAIGSLFESPQSPPLLGGSAQFPALPPNGETYAKHRETPPIGGLAPSSIPGASTPKRHDLSHSVILDQSPDQSRSAVVDDPLRSASGEETEWLVALGEASGAAPLSARPPAKTSPGDGFDADALAWGAG